MVFAVASRKRRAVPLLAATALFLGVQAWDGGLAVGDGAPCSQAVSPELLTLLEAVVAQDEKYLRSYADSGGDLDVAVPCPVDLEGLCGKDKPDNREPLSLARGEDCVVSAGMTSLFVACRLDSGPLVKLHLDLNADPYIRDASGRTALHRAASWGNLNAMAALLDAGVSPETARTLFYESFERVQPCERVGHAQHFWFETAVGATPMHDAALSGVTGSVDLLIERGGNVNARDGLGNTPLHLAVGYWDGVMTKCLLDHGADVTIVDRFGSSVLHAWAMAPLYGRTSLAAQKETLEALRHAGVDFECKDKRGQTPVDILDFYSHKEAKEMLLQFLPVPRV